MAKIQEKLVRNLGKTRKKSSQNLFLTNRGIIGYKNLGKLGQKFANNRSNINAQVRYLLKNYECFKIKVKSKVDIGIVVSTNKRSQAGGI